MIKLVVPKSDKDKIEINLDQDRREAFEDFAKNEVPKLRNSNAVFAYEYFKHGWDSAIATYSKNNDK